MPSSEPILIHEGPSRLRWKRTRQGWQLDRLWPNTREREELVSKATRGQAIYLRLESQAGEPVMAFEEEIPDLPAGVQALPAGNGVVLLRFRPFDWLPEPARREGNAFIQSLPKPGQGIFPRLWLRRSKHLRGLVFLHADPMLFDEHVLHVLNKLGVRT